MSVVGEERDACDFCLDQSITSLEAITLSLCFKRNMFVSSETFGPEVSYSLLPKLDLYFPFYANNFFVVVFQAGLTFCFSDMYTLGTELCGLKCSLLSKQGEIFIFRNVSTHVSMYIFKRVYMYGTGLWIHFDFPYVRINGRLVLFIYFPPDPVFQPEGENHALSFTLK